MHLPTRTHTQTCWLLAGVVACQEGKNSPCCWNKMELSIASVLLPSLTLVKIRLASLLLPPPLLLTSAVLSEE
jgi:hypothetical protein